jgi:RimJ/RimL family protein N-acetyltransferase
VLHGELVTLREVRRDDLPVLIGISAAPDGHALVQTGPWVPVTLARAQGDFDRRQERDDDPDTVRFAIQRRDDPAGRCLGYALVWGIDTHNRTAHLGLALTAQSRGKGLGRDAVRVLCRYAFDVRDLHRVSLETLTTNAAMRSGALACGFVEEGTLRESAWVMGRRVDEVVYGLLATQWRAAP